MKILFIGLGSIGQRHLINAKKIFKNAKFYALRIKNKNLIIKDAKLRKKGLLGDYYNIQIVKSYKSALKLKPDLNLSVIHHQTFKDAINRKNKIIYLLKTFRSFKKIGEQTNLFSKKKFNYWLDIN